MKSLSKYFKLLVVQGRSKIKWTLFFLKSLDTRVFLKHLATGHCQDSGVCKIYGFLGTPRKNDVLITLR